MTKEEQDELIGAISAALGMLAVVLIFTGVIP